MKNNFTKIKHLLSVTLTLIIILPVVLYFLSPTLEKIIYPLPESDGFSLVGHKAIIQVNNYGGDNGPIYEYIYCNPDDCLNGEAVEKISDKNFAYVRPLANADGIKGLESKNYIREVHTDFIGNLENCINTKVSMMFRTGCLGWYNVKYVNSSNENKFTFGGILIFDLWYETRRADLLKLNDSDFFALNVYDARKNQNFEAIYIYGEKQDRFALLKRADGKVLKLLSFE